MSTMSHRGDAPAIGAIELVSIARGMRTVDAMVKRAPVRVLEANPICPGKYLIVVGGMTDPVVEAMKAGREAAGSAMVDSLLLPDVHAQIQPAITATNEIGEVEAVGIIETFSAVSGITAADVACKRAAVQLIELRLARGLAGKAYFTCTGALSDVEDAIGAARAHLAETSGLLLWHEVIPNPDPALVERLL